MAPVRSSKKAKAVNKYTVDVSAAVAAQVFETEDYVKYLIEHIKIDGKTGELGDEITVEASGNTVVVLSTARFSGKYLKFLTKRYLKKAMLIDYVRFVSEKQGVYKLKFFNITDLEDEE